jgi:hypothetical protein
MIQVHGKANLDRRPGEAFKPVALSSMHISADRWDAASAQVDSQSFQIPIRGWIIHPPAVGRAFALRAGSSSWKTKAPALEIGLSENRGLQAGRPPAPIQTMTISASGRQPTTLYPFASTP